jgi:hypothetical protein
VWVALLLVLVVAYGVAAGRFARAFAKWWSAYLTARGILSRRADGSPARFAAYVRLSTLHPIQFLRAVPVRERFRASVRPDPEPEVEALRRRMVRRWWELAVVVVLAATAILAWIGVVVATERA